MWTNTQKWNNRDSIYWNVWSILSNIFSMFRSFVYVPFCIFYGWSWSYPFIKYIRSGLRHITYRNDSILFPFFFIGCHSCLWPVHIFYSLILLKYWLIRTAKPLHTKSKDKIEEIWPFDPKLISLCNARLQFFTFFIIKIPSFIKCRPNSQLFSIEIVRFYCSLLAPHKCHGLNLKSSILHWNWNLYFNQLKKLNHSDFNGSNWLFHFVINSWLWLSFEKFPSYRNLMSWLRNWARRLKQMYHIHSNS